MGFTNLKKIRIKKYIITNGILLIGILMFFVFLNYGISEKKLFLTIGIISIILVGIDFFLLKDNTLLETIFPFMKSLHEYEKLKLSTQAVKVKYSNYIFKCILIAFIFLISFSYSSNNFLELNNFTILVIILLIFLINISIYYYNYKIDTIDNIKSKNFTVKMLVFNLILGSIFTILMLHIAISLVLS